MQIITSSSACGGGRCNWMAIAGRKTRMQCNYQVSPLYSTLNSMSVVTIVQGRHSIGVLGLNLTIVTDKNMSTDKLPKDNVLNIFIYLLFLKFW